MLSDAAARKAKPEEKPYRLADERGMYLEIRPNGSKLWRLKYRMHGRERRFAIGSYPEVTLHKARMRRDDARALVAKGIDPCERRRAERRESQVAAANTFEAIGREWYEKQAPSWAPNHRDKILSRLERDVFPWLGSRSIASIDAPEILDVLRRVEHRGCNETAHRELQYCSRIFRYAIATGRARRDPAADLRGEALAPVDKSRHYGTLTSPARIGELLRATAGYSGTLVVKVALRLSPYVFVRPGELRRAAWSEFDFAECMWRIPAERMKAKVQHLVPLSRQAVTLLRELQPLTGEGKFVFPSARTSQRPMSENAVNAGLRRLGYAAGEMTGHGFRSMASTLLNEQQWNRDAIERQLAHGEKNEVRAAYNYAEFLLERRKMMQAWADYLDQLEREDAAARSAA